MKKVILILSIVCLYNVGVVSQQQDIANAPFDNRATNDSADLMGNIYVKEHIKAKKPMPYPELREADILWSKTIWRRIDVRERANHIFYYPFEKTQGRLNLINLLLEGVDRGEITAYEADNDINGDFNTPVSLKEIYKSFGAVAEVQQVRDVETGEIREVVSQAEVAPEEVKEYLLKEQWYFDKRSSTFGVRIIGMCPVREYFRDEDIDQEAPQKRRLFWVYFPEARPLLARNEIFDDRNDAQRFSYDDLFMKRYFNSYIIKESNRFDRYIQSYKLGIDAIVEAERIKDEIRTFEQDLWEY